MKKRYTDWQEEILSLLTIDMIVYLENPKEFTKIFQNQWVWQCQILKVYKSQPFSYTPQWKNQNLKLKNYKNVKNNKMLRYISNKNV